MKVLRITGRSVKRRLPSIIYRYVFARSWNLAYEFRCGRVRFMLRTALSWASWFFQVSKLQEDLKFHFVLAGIDSENHNFPEEWLCSFANEKENLCNVTQGFMRLSISMGKEKVFEVNQDSMDMGVQMIVRSPYAYITYVDPYMKKMGE